ncbi:MAG: radical SAM protein [Bacteroidota bacterium]
MAKNDLKTRILFLTPPFTQLNTPYPATAFLKGFLQTHHVPCRQADLGIEVISALFSTEGFTALFREVEKYPRKLSANARHMVQHSAGYIDTIKLVMAFLRGGNPELAHLICGRHWIPEASRFGQTTDLDHDFGHLGINDRAKYLATLYLEDISDLIVEAVDQHFGFSRYAERLGRSASSFDELDAELNQEPPGRFLDHILTGLLKQKIADYLPEIVAISVPFPGNLYSALKCGQWIKKHHANIPVVMGGGFVNTELRSLTDPRVFNYVDFITLDDGEMPLLNLTEHLAGTRKREDLKRTFALSDESVVFYNGSSDADVVQKDAGTPDYSDLPLNQYLSVIEMANPMHRLWSDGRWNKLMLAHGCYWGQCTFCDTTLDYIRRYEPNKATVICDRIEAIIAQTNHHGFHFTDEAAPPALLRELAKEIIRRKLTVVWWTNIRFETSFTRDLCLLLKESGCIAVSGGLEVASDRILKMINKGVTVAQVARVAGNFTRTGILVHAYLMYGFPTQTAQETIDSLEVVRQLFMNGVVQSGYWHQFAMTAHSPVGLNPEKFGVEKENQPPGSFANNDLIPIDKSGCNHEAFSDGLKKSLYNYMHGICFDFPLQEWFDFRIPRTTVPRNFIRNILSQNHSAKLH